MGTITSTFEQRKEEFFRAESGKALKRGKIVKRPENKEDIHKWQGDLLQEYSYSIITFAARCFYLNEMIEEANEALRENAQHYLSNTNNITDRDNFHWHADIILRLIELFGSKSSLPQALIDRETEELILKPIWLYVKQCSWLSKAEYQKSKTWHVFGSENHHAMDFSVCWHFSKIAKDHHHYQSMPLDDGAYASQHYETWNQYIIEYCIERARKGPFVEMMNPNYFVATTKGFFNFCDFGDKKLREISGKYLDLCFAYWSQEQLNGLEGGGKSRLYFKTSFGYLGHSLSRALTYLLFGIGKRPQLEATIINALLSNYRVPEIIQEIAHDVTGRGSYEVKQRAQGLGKRSATYCNVAMEKLAANQLDVTCGGVVRYSYCEPGFILGAPMVQARSTKDWVNISMENRWQGVVFADEVRTGIIPIVRPENSKSAKNAQLSVISKGCLITQKLKYNIGAAEMRVWIGPNGIATVYEEENLVLMSSADSFIAIHIPECGYHWDDGKLLNLGLDRKHGLWIVPENPNAVVIIEVVSKNRFEDLTKFTEYFSKNRPVIDNRILKYTSSYGDSFIYDTQQSSANTVNKKAIEFEPEKVLDSPFINSIYNSGIIEITKGTKKLTIDFVNMPFYARIQRTLGKLSAFARKISTINSSS